MSSRVAQRHAAGSYDSCDSRVSASGRLAALVAALMIALATLFAGTATVSYTHLTLPTIYSV